MRPQKTYMYRSCLLQYGRFPLYIPPKCRQGIPFFEFETWEMEKKIVSNTKNKAGLVFSYTLPYLQCTSPPPKKTNKLLLFSIPLTSFPTREHFRLIVIVLVHDDPWVIWFVTVNNEIPALRSNTLTKHQPVKKIRFVLNTKKLSIPNYVSSNAIYCDFI